MTARMNPGRLALLIAAVSVSWSGGSMADTTDAVVSTLDAISNTAAVVEGRVTDNTYTFDAAAGPRTVAALSDVTTHFGSYRARTLRVATLGGPISRRRWLFIPELPRLTANTRYLLFLTNVDWFYTPVVGNYVFRLERRARGSDVLIDPSGHAVQGVSAAGLLLSTDPVIDEKLDFLTPHARPRLLESQRSVLGRSMSKDAFLSSIRTLLQTAPLKGEFRRIPTAGRVWNRGVAERAASSDAVTGPKTPDDLVCADPKSQEKGCRDTGDSSPAKERQP